MLLFDFRCERRRGGEHPVVVVVVSTPISSNIRRLLLLHPAGNRGISLRTCCCCCFRRCENVRYIQSWERERKWWWWCCGGCVFENRVDRLIYIFCMYLCESGLKLGGGSSSTSYQALFKEVLTKALNTGCFLTSLTPDSFTDTRKFEPKKTGDRPKNEAKALLFPPTTTTIDDKFLNVHHHLFSAFPILIYSSSSPFISFPPCPLFDILTL